MAAGENEFESFLKSIDLAKEYLERFKETGFDDIGLVKSLESEEQRQMFDLVGLSAKPGHLLKFKKAVAAYFRSPDDTGVLNTSTQGIDNSVPSTVPQKKVQKTISLIGGKFVLGGNAKFKEEEPWEKYVIPNVKSERLTYHNNLTKEIYLSAYTSKQSGFQAYLNGQRRFRWGIECSLQILEKVVSSYKNGQIPKENIDCARYREFPEDVKMADVSKSQRALDHITTTIKTINEEKSKLLNRKKELYGDNLEPKNWASNEIAFIQAKTMQAEEMLKESEHIAHEIEHISNQLKKRFELTSVNENEKKRKAKRAKEQRSKAKKKRSDVAKSKVTCLNKESDMSSDEDIPIDILHDEL